MNQEVLANPVNDKKLKKIIESEPKIIVGNALPENENTPNDYDYVGFLPRLGARLVDSLVYLIINFVLTALIVTPILTAQAGLNSSDVNSIKDRISQKLLNSDGSVDVNKLVSQSLNTDCGNLFDNNTTDFTLCNKVNTLDKQILISTSIIIFVISVAYFVLTAVSRWQGSLGKKIFKLKLVNSDYKSISLLQSFARESFWIVFGLFSILSIFNSQASILYGLMILVIIVDSLKVFFSKQKQTIHDNLADTYVVKIKEEF